MAIAFFAGASGVSADTDDGSERDTGRRLSVAGFEIEDASEELDDDILDVDVISAGVLPGEGFVVSD